MYALDNKFLQLIYDEVMSKSNDGEENELDSNKHLFFSLIYPNKSM